MVDTPIRGRRTARESDALIASRGRPATIVSDNGSGITSRAILERTTNIGLIWHYIALGKRHQKRFVESLNGKLCDKHQARRCSPPSPKAAC